MADPITTLNNLAADPAFLQLSDAEQKILIGKVRGASPSSLSPPPPDVRNVPASRSPNYVPQVG